MKKIHNPGSIHVRVGRVLSLIEDAEAVGNIVVKANLLETLRDYSDNFMTPGEREEYDEMPGLKKDSREAYQVNADLNNRRRFLLGILVDRADVFAKGRHEQGDASALDDDLEAEEVPA